MSVVALVIAPSIAMNNNSVYNYLNSKTNINNNEVVINNNNQTIKEQLYSNEGSTEESEGIIVNARTN